MKTLFACLLGVVSFSLATAQKSFTYKFQDAATGPEASRSYQIDVSRTNVHFIVLGADNNPLMEENRAIDKIHYKVFIYNIDGCNLKSKSETQNAGCTGGTTETIIITNKNNGKEVDGYVTRCGGADNGNLKGDLEQAAKVFKAMVPGFDFKLQYLAQVAMRNSK
jgi:hypothetical protein